MNKKETLKAKLIEVISKISMEESRKKNLILALNNLQEPISIPHLSLFFTLLDLNNVIQSILTNGNVSSSEIIKNWQPAVQFYKEYGLDKQIKLSMDEQHKLVKIIDELFQYNQNTNTLQLLKQSQPQSKR